MELQTVWNGSHKHVYLCVHDPEPPRIRPARAEPVRRQMPVKVYRAYSSRQHIAAQVLALLEEQPVWLVGEMRKRLNVGSDVIGGVITRFRDKGLIQPVGQIGYVKRRTV